MSHLAIDPRIRYARRVIPRASTMRIVVPRYAPLAMLLAGWPTTALAQIQPVPVTRPARRSPRGPSALASVGAVVFGMGYLCEIPLAYLSPGDDIGFLPILGPFIGAGISFVAAGHQPGGSTDASIYEGLGIAQLVAAGVQILGLTLFGIDMRLSQGDPAPAGEGTRAGASIRLRNIALAPTRSGLMVFGSF